MPSNQSLNYKYPTKPLSMTSKALTLPNCLLSLITVWVWLPLFSPILVLSLVKWWSQMLMILWLTNDCMIYCCKVPHTASYVQCVLNQRLTHTSLYHNRWDPLDYKQTLYGFPNILKIVFIPTYTYYTHIQNTLAVFTILDSWHGSVWKISNIWIPSL